VTSPAILAGTLLGYVEARELSRYNALIVVIGVNDALRATPARSWRSSIDELIQKALSSTTAATEIFLLGVQPIRSIPTFDRFLGGVAERHGAALNQITASLCARSPRTSYIPLPAQSDDAAVPDRHRTGAQYTAWAQAIGPAIAERLNARGATASL
jgi:hypothetical protein